MQHFQLFYLYGNITGILGGEIWLRGDTGILGGEIWLGGIFCGGFLQGGIFCGEIFRGGIFRRVVHRK